VTSKYSSTRGLYATAKLLVSTLHRIRYIGFVNMQASLFFVRFSTYENSALIRQPTRTLIFYLATSTKSDDVCDTHCTKLHKKSRTVFDCSHL